MLARLLALALLVGCAAPPSLRVVHEEPSAALLAVLAIEDALDVVGAADGAGPVVLRGGEGGFERLASGDRGTLWWAAEDLDGAILFAGEGGRILRHDPASGRFDPQETPGAETLYGLFVAPDGEALAVGGDVSRESARGVLWRREGDAWVADARVPVEELDGNVLFKVWGTSSSDVWVVGERGTVLRFDGARWVRVASPVTSRLLTVHGDASGPVAVGGAGNGVLLEWDGAAFVDRMPPFMPGANGVFVAPDGTAHAVGNRATMLARARGGEWEARDDVPGTADLHAVTAGADGTVWSVGGALLSPSFDRGVVLRLGR